MKINIKVNSETRKTIAKVFGVTEKTVFNALGFCGSRGQTETSRRIRKYALEKGGKMYVTMSKEEYEKVTKIK